MMLRWQFDTTVNKLYASSSIIVNYALFAASLQTRHAALSVTDIALPMQAMLSEYLSQPYCGYVIKGGSS